MTQKSMFPLTARWFIKHTLIAGRYMGSEESEDEIFPPVQTEQRRSSPPQPWSSASLFLFISLETLCWAASCFANSIGTFDTGLFEISA